MITVYYFALTNEEVELWRDDPLKFYMDAKQESNECKGNFLREKVLRLIACFRLNFGEHFDSFVRYVIS